MDAPPQVEQIIHWAMAKRAESRPQTPLQLALALQPFCPVQVAGGRPQAPAVARQAMPLPAQMAPLHLPGHTPVEGDSQRSSVVFRLPPQTTSDDPIRRRSEGGFPWSFVLLGLGGLLVAAILGYGIYIGFIRPGQPEVDSFTTSDRSGGIKMVKLSGGTFRMGSPDSEPGRKADEGPQHEVAIKGPLLISSTEITHSQFLKVVGTSRSKSAESANRAQNRSAEWVSWDEANDFCKKLVEVEMGQPWIRKGWAFRLPTEAEWEYAARGGTETPFAFGEQIVYEKQALFRPDEKDALWTFAQGVDPSIFPKDPRFPLDVRKTEANPFGLYDMHGNVAEWCLDWYKPGYPDGVRDNPTGAADGDKRVIRGGSFRTTAAETRSAARGAARPNERRDDVGFRIVYAPAAK